MELMNMSNFCSWWPVQCLFMKIRCLPILWQCSPFPWLLAEIPESILDFLWAMEYHSSGPEDWNSCKVTILSLPQSQLTLFLHHLKAPNNSQLLRVKTWKSSISVFLTVFLISSSFLKKARGKSSCTPGLVYELLKGLLSSFRLSFLCTFFQTLENIESWVNALC